MEEENLVYKQWQQAYTSVIEFGRAMLTTSALLNGGAAAAILAAGTIEGVDIRTFKYTILIFSLGAASSLLALCLAYLSEYVVLQKTISASCPTWLVKWETRNRYVAWVFGGLSIFCFCGAILAGYIVIS